MLSTSTWRNGASVCSLWAILERGSLPQRYYLTAKACLGILRRAHRRGKELPELLARALKAVGGDIAQTITADMYKSNGATAGKNPGVRNLYPVELSNGHISHCLNAGGMGRIDYETETLVTAVSFKPSHYTRGKGGAPSDVVATLSADADKGDQESLVLGPVAFSCKDHGADAGNVAPTLRAMEFDGSHANGGGQIAVAFDTTQITSKTNRSQPQNGDPVHPLTNQGHPPAVAFRAAGQDGYTPSEVTPPLCNTDGGGTVPTVMAFNLRGREGGAMPEEADVASVRAASGGSSRSYVAGDSPWAVRRLTPFETQALQGFPDGYTHIPRKPRKIEPDEAAHYIQHGLECWRDGEQWMTRVAADGPQYRAHGNSMATTVMHWIGKQIERVAKT